MFLGGIGPLENIYANDTRMHRFPIEENTIQPYTWGDIKINITQPNILDLELAYDRHFHEIWGLQLEQLNENYYPIGNFTHSGGWYNS
ncbi:MAG: hypothetical protein ACE5R6_03185 [Candidatus Heimdallarchaeota archaeon]